MQKKDSEIKIRLEKSEKEEWQKFCKEQGTERNIAPKVEFESELQHKM